MHGCETRQWFKLVLSVPHPSALSLSNSFFSQNTHSKCLLVTKYCIFFSIVSVTSGQEGASSVSAVLQNALELLCVAFEVQHAQLARAVHMLPIDQFFGREFAPVFVPITSDCTDSEPRLLVELKYAEDIIVDVSCPTEPYHPLFYLHLIRQLSAEAVITVSFASSAIFQGLAFCVKLLTRGVCVLSIRQYH